MNINDTRIAEIQDELKTLEAQLRQKQIQAAQLQRDQSELLEKIYKKQGALDELRSQTERGK